MRFTCFIFTCVSFLIFAVVSAVPWPGAQLTDSSSPTADWSPRPTSQSIGELSILELFKRQGNLFSDRQACGWITQPTTNLIVTCSESSSCAYNTDISRVGCCDQTSRCTFYTSCIDAGSTRQGDNTDVYTCVGTSLCYENTYPNGYKQYGCGAVEWATQVETALPDGEVVEIVTTGNAAPPTSQKPVTVTQTNKQPGTTSIRTITQPAPTLSPSSSSTSSRSSSQEAASTITSQTTTSSLKSQGTKPNTKSSFTSSPTSSTGTGVAADQTSSPAPTTTAVSSHGLSTGAKAGIGVGAAVVAMIAATLILICFRRSRQRRHDPNAAELQGSSTEPWSHHAAEKARLEEVQSHGVPFKQPIHEKYGTPVEGAAELYGSMASSPAQFDPDSVRSSAVRDSSISVSPTQGNWVNPNRPGESPWQEHGNVNTSRYYE